LDASALVAYSILRMNFTMHPMPSFDALICAVMNRHEIEFLVSYDMNHFDAVDGIIRIENLSALRSRICKKR
jgi:predicted nucleic acid-binding protein